MWRAAAVRAARAILSLVVGSVLIDRQVERQPAQVQEGELWTADEVPDDPELLALLAEPADERALFDYSLGVLVRAVIAPPVAGA